MKCDLWINCVKVPLLPAETPFTDSLPKNLKPVFVQADMPDGVLHDGWNVIEIWNLEDPPIVAADIVWAEIRVEAAGK